jgi:hypothetical protein
MGQLQQRVIFLVGLVIVSKADGVVGYVAGRQGHAARELIDSAVRQVADRTGHQKSGMCVIQGPI